MTSWVEREYTHEYFIVTVKYGKSGTGHDGDISVGYTRSKGEPRKTDNSKGFTENFYAPMGWSNEAAYREAERYAQHVSKELHIPYPYGYSTNEQ